MRTIERPTSHLRVQEFLRVDPSILGHEDLKKYYGIKSVFHDEKPLVILNYDQIDSPKLHPIVRECRGLVLHAKTADIVARSFPRFFNWGEVQDEADEFDFENCSAQSKEDGSLILLYWFDGEWCVNTRGSFADGKINDSSLTWRDGVAMALGVRELNDLDRRLDRGLCYVCEFCSKWNKVVREYPTPVVYLLSVFQGPRELPEEFTDTICPDGFKRPLQYSFGSIDEVQCYIAEKSEKDPTFEGIVIRDINNVRWKVKSATYLALHRLKGDGENMYLPKNLLPFIMSGETSELLTYFPEVGQKLNEVTRIIDDAFEELVCVWHDAKSIESQKEFAQFIIPKTQMAAVLFEARKRNVSIDDVWKESSDLILKRLF